MLVYTRWTKTTGTCFIQKSMPPSSSLLQGKYLPFSPSPLRLNIFRLFVIFSLTQLYRTLPRYFSFRLPHLNIPIGPPSDELDKNIQRTSLGLLFSLWNGYNWGEVGKGKRADIYLEVSKRRGAYIFWMKQVPVTKTVNSSSIIVSIVFFYGTWSNIKNKYIIPICLTQDRSYH
jgi:hypothetical protein